MMPRPRRSLRGSLRRGWAPPLALALVLAAPPSPAGAGFLDSINPFLETKDEFEGRFADTLEPGPWKPPLARLAAERAARDAQSGNRRRFGGRSEEHDGFDALTARTEPAEPPPAGPWLVS